MKGLAYLLQAQKRQFKLFYRFNSELRKTVLYDFHVTNSAKMIEFGGWSMPGSYDRSILETVRMARTKCILFDVSHMMQSIAIGEDVIPFLESIIPSDLKNLSNNTGVYSVLLNSNGGIEDDIIVSKINNEHFYIVSNAERAKEISCLINRAIKKFKDSKFDILTERSLIAIQGPLAAKFLKPVIDLDLENFKFMTSSNIRLFGIPSRLTRCGYTGEDGFELSFPSSKAVRIVENIISMGGEDILLGGLLARDILRLEAGLCLYGQDLNDKITPIEAGLNFCIAHQRRTSMGFTGWEVIKDQLENGTKIKRVGFIGLSRIPRVNQNIYNSEGNIIGNVTSGARSPTINENIGMGYVDKDFSKVDTKIKIGSNFDEAQDGYIKKLPFIPLRYVR